MDRKILGIFLAMLLVCGGITFAAVTAPTTGNHTNHSMECNNYYWFDSTSTECGYKQFCGSFMYEDLQTFTTKTECEKALPEIIPTPIPTTTPECSYYYWFDNKTTECGYKQFCGSFMYLGLQTFKTREECETAQTPTACTMEAKICPDGTTVGRNPTLNCEFEPCPEEDNTEPEKECNGYYWFDEQSLSCGYKQFCGAFMWQGLQTFSSYEECEKALSPITEKCCPPKCMAIGSKSEGWYDSCTGERITWANCSECKATCGNKGTKSEGWYANCNNPANNLTAANFGSLIKWDCGGCADNYIMPSEGTGSETNSGGGSQRVTSTSTTSQIIQPNIVISSTGGTGGGATYSVGVCTGNQPEKCTQEYAPVCATIVRFNPTGEYNKYRKTFSNACMACGSSTKTDTVTEYVSGECEQDTDIECPMISTPAPGYCSNGETVPVYKEYNGVKCLVGFECRENPGEPADNLPVFIYTESNDSARAEKVFKLYKSGSMVETITNNAFYSGSEAEEMKKLTGKISVEETQEFLAKLGGLGFFEIDYLKDCTTQQNVDVDPTSSTTIISCPMGAANHKLYARYNNKENKLGWYNGLHETPEAIEYALGRLKYFEELLEGTPDQSEKYVKLGEAFDLYIGENAKVRETGFKVKLESIEAGMALFSISSPYIGVVEEEAPVKGESQGNTGIKIKSVSSGIVAKDIAISSVSGNPGITVSLQTNRWVKIAVGEQKTIYGHTIALNNVLFPKCEELLTGDSKTVTKCVGAKPFANLTITKPQLPGDGITAYLDKKFEIKEGQYATILDTAAIYPAKKVMHMSLESILIPVDCDVHGCEVDEETGAEICPMIYCDTRPVAKILWNTPPIEGQVTIMLMRTLTIRKGETVTQGQFKFYFADLIDGKAVFVVHKLEDQFDFKEVKLGEKFNLEEKQTALITEEDVFVTLNFIAHGPGYEENLEEVPDEQPLVEDAEDVEMFCTLEAKVCPDGTTVGRDPNNNCEFKPCPEKPEPIQTDYVVVSVWKKNGLEEPVPLTKQAEERIQTIEKNIQSVKPMIASNTTASNIGTSSTTTSAVLGHRTYRLKPGESLKVYGIELTLGDIDGKMALFIAEKTGVGSTINVHLDERFKLEENKSANVIGANINLDLLGISSYTKCIEGKETACIEEKHVKLGVSKIFKNQPVAKKVDYTQEYEAAVQKMTVKTAQETAIEPVDITLPPMPFTVLDLKEGETSSVGDFEISVLSIWADHAEFIVKEKSTGINFMFVISKGWNLFAIPGEIRTLGQNECGLSNSRLFEFNAQTQGFDKITEPRPGKAYWLYNPNEKCKADVELVKPVSMYELEQLQKGWNFVPILFGMIGSTLSEMGNCEFNGAFVYDTETNQWNNVLGTEIGRSLLGKGIAVNVQETCSLLGADTIDEIPELPALPEVG